MKTANRHEFALLKAYGKEVYTLLDSGAIPNVISRSLAESLHLLPLTTRAEFKASQATVEGKLGVVEDVPVAFNGVVVADHIPRLVRLPLQSHHRPAYAQEVEGPHGLLPGYREDQDTVGRRRG